MSDLGRRDVVAGICFGAGVAFAITLRGWWLLVPLALALLGLWLLRDSHA